VKDEYYIDALSLKIIDLEFLINNIIEKEVEEDNYKYRLQNKPSLIKKFIAYRLCSQIIQTVQNNNNKKIIFYFNENLKLEFLNDYFHYIKLTLQQLSKILSFNVFYNILKINELQKLLSLTTGESKEIKVRLLALAYRTKLIPNITKFNKFLEKNGIHRLDNNPAESYKIRLGLFIA